MPHLLITIFVVVVCCGCAPQFRRTPSPTLAPYTSSAELHRAMDRVVKAREIERARERAQWRKECLKWSKGKGGSCDNVLMETVTVSSANPIVESITNNQHAGVDEGGIVKRQGDLLIVLRRGRLFTIHIGDGQLDFVDAADAFGADDLPDSDQAWYDELLVWNDTIVVVGFNYGRGGTEIGLFDLGPNGTLGHRETYHIRSHDYYSSSNYASRLIGDRLFLFTSFSVPDDANPSAWLPAIRRWDGPQSRPAFSSIAPVSQVFHPTRALGAYPTVHSLVSCHIAATPLDCTATVVLGDPLDVYYASPRAAYAWTSRWTERGRTHSTLYRIPFDGTAAAAIGVTGTPPGQLAFLEDEQHNLNVVVAHDDNDVVSLLRVPAMAFSDGSVDAPMEMYRPIAHGLGQALSARVVGRYALIGARSWDDEPDRRQLVVSELERARTFTLTLAHDVQRIEAIGEDVVAFGMDSSHLGATTIRLEAQPVIAGLLTFKDWIQSEHRSHAFSYRRDGGSTGLFGLPMIRYNETGNVNGEARVIFVSNDRLALALAGAVAASPTAQEDGCRASCFDWYGNARPIFLGSRIFALMGYELVEVTVAGGQMRELRRLDFTPAGASSR